MVREISSHQRLSEITNNSVDLAEIVKEADNICRGCEPLSPIICVERCEVWGIKNEFLKMNGTLSADDYLPNLLNAVKNDRRREVTAALSEHARSIKELQEHLKKKGYYHSRSTIASTYVEPLMGVELLKEGGDKYRLTLYGRKFEEVLSRFDVKDSLPSRSRCYEETLLRKLKDGPKTYDDLGEFVPRSILSRSIRRLREKGLLSKSKSPYYVFYFRTKKVPKKKFSPTEKRVYEAIPEAGASASELSEKVGINLRRTYKYLRRLKRKRLAFRRKSPRTYELTPSGRDVANFLEETMNLISDASRASAFLLDRSRQTVASPDFQSDADSAL